MLAQPTDGHTLVLSSLGRGVCVVTSEIRQEQTPLLKAHYGKRVSRSLNPVLRLFVPTPVHPLQHPFCPLPSETRMISERGVTLRAILSFAPWPSLLSLLWPLLSVLGCLLGLSMVLSQSYWRCTASINTYQHHRTERPAEQIPHGSPLSPKTYTTEYRRKERQPCTKKKTRVYQRQSKNT